MTVGKHLVLRAGGDLLAIPIADVRSVVAYATPSPLPGSPPHVRGVVQLRGRIVPVVDLAAAIGGAVVEPGAYTVLVTVQDARGATTGVPADEVLGVLDLAGASPLPCGGATTVSPVDFEGRVYLVVDVSRVLGSEPNRPVLEARP